MESRYSCTLTSNSPVERQRIMNHWITSLQLDLFLSQQVFTFQSLPVELSLLDEPAEHLGLHEDLQEATHGLRRDRLTKTFALEGAGDRGGGRGGVAVFPFTGDEEWIVAYQLHEETDEGLGHNGAEMARICRQEDKLCNMNLPCCKVKWLVFSFSPCYVSPPPASPPLSLASSLLLSRTFSRADWSLDGRMESSSSN